MALPLADTALGTPPSAVAGFLGRNGRISARPLLPRKIVDDYKRERCVEAVADLAHEIGLANVSASEVIRAARIARATFYQLFRSKEQAFRFACGVCRHGVVEPMRTAAEAPGTWLEKVERGLDAFLAAVIEAPRRAELSLIHSVALDAPPAGLRNPEAVDALAQLLSLGRKANPDRTYPPDLEHFLAAGIVSAITMRLHCDDLASLLVLRGELVVLVEDAFC